MTLRDPTRSPIQLARARRLRQDATDAEALLWRHLRGGQLGEKFRRQHRIGPFIADFFCARLALVIELDGGQHFTEEGRRRDARRTSFLNSLGVRVVRFSDAEILTQSQVVLERIRQIIAGEASGPLTPTLSPGRGEGE